jgi:hypothetical protein
MTTTETTETTETTKHAIADNDYYGPIGKIFGPLSERLLETYVYTVATTLSDDYFSIDWEFCSLSNGGFFMSPRSGKTFNVSCVDGAPVKLSADGLGITACLFTFSQLSFDRSAFAATCGRHYHLLRAFASEHAEASAIYRATH